MDDGVNFLERLRTGGPAAKAEPADDDEVVVQNAYALARGVRPVAMLELRRVTGNVVALDYGWLSRAEFDPSRGVELRFERTVVRLAGQHLRPLFDGLVRKRVLWVQEAEPLAAADRPAGETVVTAVVVGEPGEAGSSPVGPW